MCSNYTKNELIINNNIPLNLNTFAIKTSWHYSNVMYSSNNSFFFQLIAFITVNQEPNQWETCNFNKIICLNVWQKDIECLRNCLAKQKYWENLNSLHCLTSLFIFYFNHKCNLVSINSKCFFITLALKTYSQHVFGLVDSAETTETAESTEILLSLPNQFQSMVLTLAYKSFST